MKILKIFGIVVGIHLFALILIFANPGCSSTTKPPPQPADTTANASPAPSITVPNMNAPSVAADPSAPAVTPATGGFNPDAPATAASSTGGFNPDAPATYGGSSNLGVRFAPTRPNTPAASAVLAQPVENVTPATTYVVKAGDSLWTLQKKFHINLREIAAANNLKISSPLHQGQKLIIPTKPVTPGAAAATTSSSRSAMAAPAATTPPRTEATGATRSERDEVKYTVKPGETLGMIARRFDVKTRELAVRNNITDPRNLRAGTELTIPGWRSPGSGSRASKSSSTTSAPAPTPSTSTDTSTVPNILEPSPSEPSQTPTTSVPVINLDESPVTPAPPPKG